MATEDKVIRTIIETACLKHSDSGETSINIQARRIVEALKESGFTIKGVASTPPSVAHTEEKKKQLEQIFDDNENYISSYTGTPMIKSDIVIPKILELFSDTNREGWVKVEDGDRLVPMSEIESFIKVYNHEYHGKMWTIHSFLTGLNNWLKPKVS